MIRSKRLEFTHLGRRILIFPVADEGTDVMLTIEGAVYGPFPTRHAALTTVPKVVEGRTRWEDAGLRVAC